MIPSAFSPLEAAVNVGAVEDLIRRLGVSPAPVGSPCFFSTPKVEVDAALRAYQGGIEIARPFVMVAEGQGYMVQFRFPRSRRRRIRRKWAQRPENYRREDSLLKAMDVLGRQVRNKIERDIWCALCSSGPIVNVTNVT